MVTTQPKLLSNCVKSCIIITNQKPHKSLNLKKIIPFNALKTNPKKALIILNKNCVEILRF